jgi:hypothetical protein
MFVYAKVGQSKYVEMHRDTSEIYLSALVFYTLHRILRSIELFIYIQTCENFNAFAINRRANWQRHLSSADDYNKYELLQFAWYF